MEVSKTVRLWHTDARGVEHFVTEFNCLTDNITEIQKLASGYDYDWMEVVDKNEGV